MFPSGGIWDGLSTKTISPSVLKTWYSTFGTVVTIVWLYSRSRRSWVISIWRRPKNPHLNPNPSAEEVSGSNTSDASLVLSFIRDSLRSSNSSLADGYIPENTIGLTFFYTPRGSVAGFAVLMIVSPTKSSLAVLIPVTRYPTSPDLSDGVFILFILKMPTSSASVEISVAKNLILSPVLSSPSNTLRYTIMPRYESKVESKTSALKGAFRFIAGGGILFIIASKIS